MRGAARDFGLIWLVLAGDYFTTGLDLLPQQFTDRARFGSLAGLRRYSVGQAVATLANLEDAYRLVSNGPQYYISLAPCDRRLVLLTEPGPSNVQSELLRLRNSRLLKPPMEKQCASND